MFGTPMSQWIFPFLYRGGGKERREMRKSCKCNMNLQNKNWWLAYQMLSRRAIFQVRHHLGQMLAVWCHKSECLSVFIDDKFMLIRVVIDLPAVVMCQLSCLQEGDRYISYAWNSFSSPLPPPKSHSPVAMLTVKVVRYLSKHNEYGCRGKEAFLWKVKNQY